MRSSLNVAFTLAGLTDSVVVTEAMVSMVASAGLTCLEDFRGKFRGWNDL